MLILTRKPGESLLIGENIEIKITDISGDRVKIGIAAPPEYKVLRGELKQTIESNQRAARAVSSSELRSFFAGLRQQGEPEQQTAPEPEQPAGSQQPE